MALGIYETSPGIFKVGKNIADALNSNIMGFNSEANAKAYIANLGETLISPPISGAKANKPMSQTGPAVTGEVIV